MVEFEIMCPTCESKLQIQDEVSRNTCTTCGHTFATSNGIIDFIPENNFYWGEISEDLMKQINKQAETDHWFKALTSNLTGKYEVYLDYILDPVRYAGIFHFYNPAQADTCLDLGSGWGPISFGLSRFFKKVYSVDGAYERLHFQSIRARQSGIKNIKFMRSTMLSLPIPDNTVDVVIVNGLLEWIGLSEPNASPADLQKRFLKEVMRVLKPQGQLMIGIENRFGLQYFRGTKDHSGLRFTSLMPRKLANWVVKKVKRGDDALVFSGAEDSYRTLTYSYWGYEDLVKKAGFHDPEIYWSWPTYNYPHVTGTTEGGSLRYYLDTMLDSTNNGLYRAAIRMARLGPDSLMKSVIKLFSPHFLIIAHKGEASGRLQDQFVDEDRMSFIRTNPGTRSDFRTTYHCLQDGKLSKLVNVLEDNITNGHRKLTAQEFVGIQGRVFRPNDLQDIRLAGDWLSAFHSGSTQGFWQTEDLSADIGTLIAKILQLYPDKHELRDFLLGYQARFVQAVASVSIPRVTEQGDFTISNMLVDDSGKLNVIDWENKLPNGHPFMDIGAFYLSLLRRNNKLESNAFANTKAQEINEFISTYQANKASVLPFHLAPAYYLLRLVSRASQDQDLNPDNYMFIKGWMKLLSPCINLAERRVFEEVSMPVAG